MIDQAAVAPVRKSVTVKTSAAHAFHVYTAGFHTWWPKSHHIGSSPMTKAIIEEKTGGRCYSEQQDGTECDWGKVLAFDPPRRLVLAWQIDGKWQYEPDLKKCSEVEITFTPLADGTTRVDLEHRHLERHGEDAMAIRTGIESPSGWATLLQIFATEAEKA